MFEIPSHVLFALFPVCTQEVDLFTIETVNHFTNSTSAFHHLLWNINAKLLERGGAKVSLCNFFKQGIKSLTFHFNHKSIFITNIAIYHMAARMLLGRGTIASGGSTN